MKFTNTFRFRLPQRTIPQENDPANIDDLNFNATSIDSILKLNADELTRLETDKATKAALTLHEENKSNPHSVSKAQAGLGNADNTSDINKPVSTAQAAAIKAVQGDVNNHKSDKTNPHGTVAHQVGAYTQAETDAKNKVIQDDLSAHKANAQNPHSTTAEQVGTYTKAVIDAKDKAIIDAATAHCNDNDRHINNGERPKWNDKYTKSEVDNKFSMLETNTDWKESVTTFADIAKTYPTPQDGWTVNTRDTDYTYRYSGTDWVVISANAIPKATANIDGLQTKENVAEVTANTANRHNHNNLSLLQAITQTLVNNWNAAFTHVSDTVKHITASERANWDSKATGNHNHSGTYEPVFTKNNAFNKNFGNAAGTVCQGNDARLSDARPANGGNATTVGEKNIGSLFKDNGAVGNVDWNSLLSIGTYGIGQRDAFSSSLNQPVGAYVYGVLLIVRSGTYGVTQVYFPHTSGGVGSEMYWRTGFSNGSFQSWRKVTDAHTLDGLGSTAFAKAKKITLAELNSTNLTAGIYNIQDVSLSSVGLPGSYAHIFVGGDYSGGGFDGQIAIPYESGIMNGVWYRVAISTNYPVFRRIDDYSNLVNKPQSLPASDVYPWAKQPAKPLYTASEVGALPIGGGTLTGNLILNTAPTSNLQAATKKYVDDSISIVGGGDMLKAVYDANNDGIVDNAALLGGLASSAFCMADDSKLSNARPASDVYPWAKAASKPAYTASEVGLGNVNNIADASKRVHYATSAGSMDGGTW